MPKTLFFIHGMWCGSWLWKNYIEFFEAKGYRCVAPTLPYHDVDPGSPPPPELGTCSLTTYVDFLETEAKKLDETPILIGHSMGGFLTQSLASRGVGKAAVLLAPAAPAGIVAIKWSVIKVFSEALTTWGFWRKPFKPSYEKTVFGMYHLTPEDERREIYENMVYESGRASAELAFWLIDPNKAAYVDESKVTIPILAIAGAQDRIVPASVVRQVAKKYQNVTYKEFEKNAHHLVGNPNWEEVVTYVSEWISNLEQTE